MFITEKTDIVTSCNNCEQTDKYFTYKVGKEYLCVLCATQHVFKKCTKITTRLVQQFENGVDYESKLALVENIIKNGEGPRPLRVKAAKIAARPIPLEVRHLGFGKYVILSPIGKRVFTAESKENPFGPLPSINPEDPFNSICDHVQDQLNKGISTYKIAEFIWAIRGKFDYITAMMYDKYVIVTWPEEQRMLFPKC